MGLESWALDILKQVPALVVLVWLVHKFMSHLSARDKVLVEYLTRRDVAITGISEQCHATQMEAVQATRENTKVLATLATVVNDCQLRHKGSE